MVKKKVGSNENNEVINEAKKLLPHKVEQMRQISDKLKDLVKKIPFGEKFYSSGYSYWGRQIKDLLSETQVIVSWLIRLQYEQKKINLLISRRKDVNGNQPKLGGPLQLAEIPFTLQDALTNLSDELTFIADKIKSPKGKKDKSGNGTIDIPPERKSTPLNLIRMAQYWGGDMTVKKIRSMINGGQLRVIKINRQSFIFDTKLLPKHVIEKVKK